MSSYHRTTHRSREVMYPKIIDHGDTKGHAFNEMPEKDTAMDKALINTLPSKREDQRFKDSLKPKVSVHVNVNKADPDVQKVVRKNGVSKKNGNVVVKKNSK